MTRFAAFDISSFLPEQESMEDVLTDASKLQSIENAKNTEFAGQLAGKYGSSLGSIEYADKVGQARSGAANDALMGNLFSTLGGVAASGLSAYGKLHGYGLSGADKYGYDPAGSQGNPSGTGPRVRAGGY
jgi:hypothetical protein